MHARKVAVILAAVVAAVPLSVPAQTRVSGGIEGATDDRRRGLSWSDGRAVAAAELLVQTPAGWDASVRATTTRGSNRHAGADAAVDLEGGYTRDVGPIRLDARVQGHLFTGTRGQMSYWEFGGGAGFLYGPLQLDLIGRYARPAAAIGGDNLYLAARASAGIPRTPYMLSMEVGRSTGHVDDPHRAARLRPEGRYHDWRFGVERVMGRAMVAIEYSGTDIDGRPSPSRFAVRQHAGDRVTLRAGLRF